MTWTAGTAIVMAIALAACITGLANKFAHDDVLIILGDPRIRAFGQWREIFSSAYWPPPFRQDLYRPLTTLLLSIEYAVGGGSPVVFHVVSAAAYALAAVGVLRLARRLLPWRAAMGVAALFAAHPVHTEAVALGVNQNELLVAIIACAMVGRYIDRRRDGALRPRDWVLVGVMYLAAMLLKEHGVMLIALLAAAELLLVPGTVPVKLRATWRGYVGLSVVALAVVAVRTALLSSVVGSFTAEALAGVGLRGRLLTVLQVVPQWLRLLAWPVHLRADYSPREFMASTGFGPHEALGAALVVAAVATVWWTRRRAPVVAFGLVWCGIALIPVSNLILPIGILIAERTLFLPSVGLLLAAGAAVQEILSRASSSQRRAMAAGLPAAAAAVCTVAVLVGVHRSEGRLRIWRNDAYLWLASAHDAPRSFRVQYALGDVLFSLGRRGPAVQAYERAIAVAPEPWRIRIAFARRLRDAGDDSSAIVQLRASLAERPRQPDAQAELIAALIATGQYAVAGAEARQASGETAAPVFVGLERVGDSAAAAHAPPGSVRLRILTGTENVLGPAAAPVNGP